MLMPHTTILPRNPGIKKKKKTDTYFLGNYQKSCCDVRRKSTTVVELDSSEKCNYCGLGHLDKPAWWVQCDICNGWIHQDCENPARDYEKSFICKCCRGLSESDVKINVPTTYLGKLQISL